MSKRRKRRKLTAEEKNSKEYDMPGIRRWRALQVIKYLEDHFDPRAPIPLIPDMQGWALDVLQVYLRQNPPRPIAPLRIAKLVDLEMTLDPGLIEGEIAITVADARKKIAVLTNKPLTAVTAAHLKYGRTRGIRGRPKKWNFST